MTIQFLGAVGILGAFVLLQTGRTTAHSLLYLALNLVGAAVLTWLAVVESQWGFVLLQGVWALAALVGMLRRIRTGPPAPRRPTGQDRPIS